MSAMDQAQAQAPAHTPTTPAAASGSGSTTTPTSSSSSSSSSQSATTLRGTPRKRAPRRSPVTQAERISRAERVRGLWDALTPEERRLRTAAATEGRALSRDALAEVAVKIAVDLMREARERETAR